MNRIQSLFCAVAVLGVLAGCSKPNPLVGKWTADKPPVKINFAFNADGTCEQQVTGKMFEKNINMVTSGKYTLVDKKLTVTMDTAKFEGFPEELKKQAEEDFTKNGKGKSQDGTVEFKGTDEVTIIGYVKGAAGSGADMTFKKVK